MAIGMITKEMMVSDDYIEMNIVASQKPRKEDMLDGDTLLSRLVGLLSEKETN